MSATVRILADLIEMTLTKTDSVPVEDRLARFPEGRTLIEQVHGESFRIGEGVLRGEIERGVGVTILGRISRLDLDARSTTVVIKLSHPLRDTEEPARSRAGFAADTAMGSEDWKPRSLRDVGAAAPPDDPAVRPS